VLAACLALFLLLAGTGLCLDVSRLILARKQMRAQASAAALAAAIELDGTPEGLRRARKAVSGFEAEKVEFAAAAGGDWSAEPGAPEAVRLARATFGVAVPLTLVRTLVDCDSIFVRGQAVAQAGGPGGKLRAELLP
jgi:Flp pilus assembly protein TadG